MTKPLLDLSGKIDPALIEVCGVVANCNENLQIPYLVIGAFARDLVMHHGYGAPVQRATTDIDFALQVPSWAAFVALKTELVNNGFTETRSEHRLTAPNNYPVDIVPFGGVANQNANIQWPPSGDVIMNVLGFQEALDHADQVMLNNKHGLQIPVASPVGMMLLKLIAWSDRALDVRKKDAKDIAYLLTTYETIPAISNQLYNDQDLMTVYGWDITSISELFNNQSPELQIEHLVKEMSGGSTHQNTRNDNLIDAYKAGFEN